MFVKKLGAMAARDRSYARRHLSSCPNPNICELLNVLHQLYHLLLLQRILYRFGLNFSAVEAFLYSELLAILHTEIKLLLYMTTLVAGKGSPFKVAMFLLWAQIDHKIETRYTEEYFRLSKLPLIPFSQLLIHAWIEYGWMKSILMDRSNQKLSLPISLCLWNSKMGTTHKHNFEWKQGIKL